MGKVLCKAFVKNAGWIEEFFRDGESGQTYLSTTNPDIQVLFPLQALIYPESICVFSGHFDKDGAKIYENDYVKTGGKIYKVVKEKAEFILEKVTKDSKPYIIPLKETLQSDVKILGNMYDAIE